MYVRTILVCFLCPVARPFDYRYRTVTEPLQNHENRKNKIGSKSSVACLKRRRTSVERRFTREQPFIAVIAKMQTLLIRGDDLFLQVTFILL